MCSTPKGSSVSQVPRLREDRSNGDAAYRRALRRSSRRLDRRQREAEAHAHDDDAGLSGESTQAAPSVQPEVVESPLNVWQRLVLWVHGSPS